MAIDGQSEAAIRSFEAALQALIAGQVTMIAESSIRPATELPKLVDITEAPKDEVGELLSQTVVIKLNGGLGTGMGLTKAKSLVSIRKGCAFLDLIALQVRSLRAKHQSTLPFLLMSSFSTAEDTAACLAAYPDLGNPSTLQFLQSRVPKVDAATMKPVSYPADPSLEWCPPGHGDLYPSIQGSGKLDALLDSGVRYAFVSNSDNLGATLNSDLLHHFVHSDKALMMEVTRRTAADRKGGHLALEQDNGHLLLRESAQCADEDTAAFQDIDTHRYFNTNNLWLRLDLIKEALDANDGVLPLPVIKNDKTVDPRDKASTKVIQLETAMGAAIGTLESTGAIVVDRSRFAPVKTTNDLFALRSDAFILTENYYLELHPDLGGVPPNVALDPTYYKLIDNMEALLGENIPSLMNCGALTVQGPVNFDENVILQGQVTIINAHGEPRTVPTGTYVDQTLTL